jgi:hypothetical protein
VCVYVCVCADRLRPGFLRPRRRVAAAAAAAAADDDDGEADIEDDSLIMAQRCLERACLRLATQPETTFAACLRRLSNVDSEQEDHLQKDPSRVANICVHMRYLIDDRMHTQTHRFLAMFRANQCMRILRMSSLSSLHSFITVVVFIRYGTETEREREREKREREREREREMEREQEERERELNGTHTHAHSRRNNGTLRHVVVTHNDTHLSIHHCIRTHTTGRTGRSRTAERTLVAIFLFRGGSGETTHCLMQRTIMQFETVQAHAADASGAPHLMLSQLDFTTRQFQRCVMKDQRDSQKRSHLHIAVLRYVLHSPLPCTPLHLLSLSAVLALSISPILSFSLSLSLSLALLSSTLPALYGIVVLSGCRHLPRS